MNSENLYIPEAFTSVIQYLQRPIRILANYDRRNLQADLNAGLTVAVVGLPQAIAFAFIAHLPPEMGIYTTIIGGIFGALWGSSNELNTGPTNALSLLVASALVNSGLPTSQFALAAGLMALMVGIFQMALGFLRLGLLVNFVSHSVVVGLTAGFGILIFLGQMGTLLGLELHGTPPEVMWGLVTNLAHVHWVTAVLGLGTMILVLGLRRINPNLPAPLIALVVIGLVVFMLGLNQPQYGIAFIASLHSTIPPFAHLPVFNLEMISSLSTGALAIATIGLVQTMAVARSIATQTSQRLDSNQEFVGQGIANIATAFLSGFPCSASISGSMLNYRSGAKSPLAVIFSSFIALLILFVFGRFVPYIPNSALAALIIPIAYGLVDTHEIRRIGRGVRGDAVIMVATFLGTLFLHIEFAVLIGIMLSLVIYILRTSTPRVLTVLPADNFRHFRYQPNKPFCPQLEVVEILGDLYFGAVNHVEEVILDRASKQPNQRYLLIRMNHVNHCDFSGIHMLESVVRFYRDRGGDVFLTRINHPIMQLMKSTGFDQYLHEDHMMDEDDVVNYLFHRILDPAICIYECPVRVFKECQNLPKRIEVWGIPLDHEVPDGRVLEIKPLKLWQELHEANGRSSYLLIDVREPREYRHGHIPNSQLIPLADILSDEVKLPRDKEIILICRTGRRSRRAAYALQHIGCTKVRTLEGGILAWESAGLLEAVEGDLSA